MSGISEIEQLKRVRAEISRLKRDIEQKKRRIGCGNRHSIVKEHLCRRYVPGSSLRMKTSDDVTETASASRDVAEEPLKNSAASQAMRSTSREVSEFMQLRARRKALLRDKRREILWHLALSKNSKATDYCDRIIIGSSKYAVKSVGAYLVPISGEKQLEGSVVVWNEWKYIAGKSGVLVRSFGSRQKEQCRFFSRLGMCSRDTSCRYVHDVSRIRLCRHFSSHGCHEDCMLSHDPNEFNTPICRYHLEDKCSSPDCRYLHKLPPFSKDKTYTVWTCRPFAIAGFCGRGAKCPFLHLYNCPDYEESGNCPRANSCQLTHSISKRHLLRIIQPTQVDDVLIFPEPFFHTRNILSSYTVKSSQLFDVPEPFDGDIPACDFVLSFESSDEE